MINLLGILFSLNSSEINTTQCIIINNIYSYTTDESAFFHQIENPPQKDHPQEHCARQMIKFRGSHYYCTAFHIPLSVTLPKRVNFNYARHNLSFVINFGVIDGRWQLPHCTFVTLTLNKTKKVSIYVLTKRH